MLGELAGKARADGGLDMKAVDGIRMDAVESVPYTAPSRVSIGGVSALLCHDCVCVPPIIFCWMH